MKQHFDRTQLLQASHEVHFSSKRWSWAILLDKGRQGYAVQEHVTQVILWLPETLLEDSQKYMEAGYFVVV